MYQWIAILGFSVMMAACEHAENGESIYEEDALAHHDAARLSAQAVKKANFSVFEADLEGVCECNCDVSPGTSDDEDVDIRGVSRSECLSDVQDEDCVTSEGDAGVLVGCDYVYRPVVKKPKLSVKR